MKLGELCGGGARDVTDLGACVDQIAQLRKIAGDAPVDRGLACIAKATSCPQAGGCMAGAGMSGLSSALREFADGFDQATK